MSDNHKASAPGAPDNAGEGRDLPFMRDGFVIVSVKDGRADKTIVVPCNGTEPRVEDVQALSPELAFFL